MAAATQAARPARTSLAAGAEPGAVIKEYEKRNLDVVRNLFLYNKYICDIYNYYTMDTLLNVQFKLIDQYYPEIKFKEKYYDKLVAYTNKMMILL